MDSTQAKIFIADVKGKTIGGWQILDTYGHGKSAIVMKGINEGQIAAVKIFHPELIERYGKSTQLERIGREKKLIGKHHPNLVQILDGGECESTGHLFVVMESLELDNLHSQLSKIPKEEIPNIISQIASAAQYLEELELAHRDIKPENIAISPDFKKGHLARLGGSSAYWKFKFNRRGLPVFYWDSPI